MITRKARAGKAVPGEDRIGAQDEAAAAVEIQGLHHEDAARQHQHLHRQHDDRHGARDDALIGAAPELADAGQQDHDEHDRCEHDAVAGGALEQRELAGGDPGNRRDENDREMQRTPVEAPESGPHQPPAEEGGGIGEFDGDEVRDVSARGDARDADPAEQQRRRPMAQRARDPVSWPR